MRLALAHFLDLPDPESGSIYEKTRILDDAGYALSRDELGWVVAVNRKTGKAMRVPPHMVRRIVEYSDPPPPAPVEPETRPEGKRRR